MIKAIVSLLLILTSVALLASPTQLQKGQDGTEWLEVSDYRLWLPLAKGWSWQREDKNGLLTLQLRAPRGMAGISIWGGDIGRRLEWQQLAQVWQERSAALGNMAEQVDSPTQTLATGVDGVVVHYQSWYGRVAGQPTLTRVGYLVDGERAFVIMGIWLAGDGETARQINGQLEGLRLVRPVTLPAEKPQPTPDSSPKPTKAEQLPQALPPLPEADTGPATTAGDKSAPAQQQALNQLPTPRLAPEAPVSMSPEAVELRAPLPTKPLIRNLQLKQAKAAKDAKADGAAISRWQEQLDFSAQVFNLAKDAPLEAVWLLNDTQLVGRQFLRSAGESLIFQLKPSQGLFQAGDWRLELRLEDVLLARLDFQLRDPDESELLALSEQGNAKARLGLYAYLEMGRLKHLTEAEALQELEKAAAQKLPMAQYLLGLSYLEGRHGQKKDATKAMDWFRAAALQNQPEAAHALAMGYRAGLGVAKDPAEAFAWSKKAAELGHASAFFFLGMHYLMGRGVDKNEPEARTWLAKAAAQGDVDALEVLRHLKSRTANPDTSPGQAQSPPRQ